MEMKTAKEKKASSNSNKKEKQVRAKILSKKG